MEPFCSVVFSTPYIFEPPKKLEKSIYTCDKKFHLDSILEMYKEECCYGIVLISGSDVKCYKVIKTGEYEQIIQLSKKKIKLEKKQKKGGQSAQRFQRIRLEKEDWFIKNTAEDIIDIYMEENNTQCIVESFIFVGPADKKQKLLENSIIKQFIGDKIVATRTCSQITESTVHEVWNENKNLLISEKEREIITEIQKLNENMLLGNDKIIIGIKETIDALIISNLQKVYVDLSIDFEQFVNINSCGAEIIKTNVLDTIGVDIIGIKYY